MSTAILEAFFQRLQTLGLSPALPIIYPGKGGTPPSTGQWLEVSWFPNEPENYAWDSGTAVQLGFCQVMVGYRPGYGTFAASGIADTIISHFPKGLELGDVSVVKTPWQSPEVTEDDRLYIPVTIPYRGIC